MAFTVETGAGLSAANSYISEAAFELYCEERARTPAAGDVEAALIRASAWIDGQFGGRFSGTRLNGRGQGLLWPRENAVDREGVAIADDSVPVEIQRATAEAALRELTEPGSLAPDVTAAAGGGAIKRIREKLGPMEEETEYAVSSAGEGPAAPLFPLIEKILAPLLDRTSGSMMVRLLRV